MNNGTIRKIAKGLVGLVSIPIVCLGLESCAMFEVNQDKDETDNPVLGKQPIEPESEYDRITEQELLRMDSKENKNKPRLPQGTRTYQLSNGDVYTLTPNAETDLRYAGGIYAGTARCIQKSKSIKKQNVEKIYCSGGFGAVDMVRYPSVWRTVLTIADSNKDKNITNLEARDYLKAVIRKSK